MSRKILIQLYSERDSPHLFVNRSKSADAEREDSLIHFPYINPRIIKYILHEGPERQEGNQERERSIANNQLKHEQNNNNSEDLYRDKSISDNLSSSPIQQKPLKEKKLKFKNLNFNPSANTNIDSNYSLEINQDVAATQNNQSSQHNLQVQQQQHIKNSNYSYQSQHSSESVASNLNTTIKSTSLNLDEPSYCDFKKEEADSKRLQEEYLKNKFQTFENEIKNNLIKFSTHRYYKFILQNVLESGNQGHKEWIISKIYDNYEIVCNDQYGSKIFILCLQVAKREFEDYYQNYVDLIFKDCEQVEQIYFSRFGQKIIREYLNILEGEDLVQLLKVINTKLLDPFEFSNQNIDFLSSNLLSKKYLCGEQYGCLIVNYIVEQYSSNQFKESTLMIHQIIMRIVKKAYQLSQHYYSNYVIQLILEKLPNNCIINQQLNRVFLPYFIDLSTNKFGSNVIEKAIRFGDDYFREEIWKIVSCQSAENEFWNLEKLVNDQYANYVIQRYYEYCNSNAIKQQFEEILHILNTQNKLQQYGQHVRMQIFDKNKSETKAHHFQQKDYNNTSFNRTTYPQNSKINNLNYNFNTNATQKKYNYSRNGSTVSSESGGLESVSSRKSSSNIPSHLVDSSNQTNQVQLGPQYSGQQYLPSDQNIIGYGNIQQSSNILVNANYHQKNYNQISNQNKSQYNNQYFNQNNSIHPFNYSQNVNQKVQHFYNYSNNNNTFQQAQNLQTNTYSQYPLENPNIQTQNQNQFSSQSESNNFSGQKNQFKPKLNQAGGSYKGVGQKMMTNNFQQINQGYQVNYSNYQNIQNNNNVQASSNQKLSAENSRKMLNQNFNNSNQFELKQSIEDNNINNSESSQPKYYQQGYNPDAIEDNNQ